MRKLTALLAASILVLSAGSALAATGPLVPTPLSVLSASASPSLGGYLDPLAVSNCQQLVNLYKAAVKAKESHNVLAQAWTIDAEQCGSFFTKNAAPEFPPKN